MLVSRLSAIFFTIAASAPVIEQAPSSLAPQFARPSSWANSSSYLPITAHISLMVAPESSFSWMLLLLQNPELG